jgi:hypothetical protein
LPTTDTKSVSLPTFYDRIRHPARRFSTEDLLEVLLEQLENIIAEAARIRRGPVVVEEED